MKRSDGLDILAALWAIAFLLTLLIHDDLLSVAVGVIYVLSVVRATAIWMKERRDDA
jgi:hypothetical protein